MTDTTDRTKWWRRFRFRLSLRLLMVVVLIIGGLLGWVGYRARVQRQAVATLVQAGVKVGYDFQEPGASPAWWQPKWLVDAVGVDYLAHVARVQVDPMAQRTDRASGLTDTDLALVGRLAHLETLSLVGSQAFTDAGLAHLQNLTRLKRLDIMGQPGISGASLAHLAGLARLEQLQFTTPRIDDADLAHLSGLVGLRSLTLMLDENSGVTDAGLAHLEPLQELRSLQFDQATRITNQGLAHLGKLARLDSLNLTNARVTDLKGLESLTDLRILNLMGTPIGDAGHASLPRFSKLELLSAGRELTDAGLIHLRELPGLISLDLSSTRITDAGLATLGEFPRLERVDVGFTAVGDPGIAALDKLPKLNSLNVLLTKVTDEGVKAAKAAHPGLTVIGPQAPQGTGFFGTSFIAIPNSP